MLKRTELPGPPLCLPYLPNLTIYSFITSKALFHQRMRSEAFIYRPHTTGSGRYTDYCAMLFSTSGSYERRIVTIILRSRSNKVTVKHRSNIIMSHILNHNTEIFCKFICNILGTKRSIKDIELPRNVFGMVTMDRIRD